ncbi:MAG: energy transducer TonB, partial [Psychromonas sp.]|nr:energy transducer TonB [Psychromonas sp.]
QKAIQETSALNDARLKSELFARDLSLEPTTAKTLQESTEKMPLTKDKATKVIPPVATQEKPQALQKQQKSKPVVKKKPAANRSSILSQGVLQEAIVVSGKTPVYPRRAILRNQQGRVIIKLTVTSKGKAKNPQIINSSGYSILDNAVLSFIEKELFMPAHKGDEKITTEQIFSFRFELK